jgi:hypothetical protein
MFIEHNGGLHLLSIRLLEVVSIILHLQNQQKKTGELSAFDLDSVVTNSGKDDIS